MVAVAYESEVDLPCRLVETVMQGPRERGNKEASGKSSAVRSAGADESKLPLVVSTLCGESLGGKNANAR